jgi:RHH-type rel operon transcriptional repressor/antitoxin RelB
MYDKGDNMSILSVRVPDEIHDRLIKLAEKTRRTKSSFINEMIETSLEEYEEAYLALERLNEKNAGYLTTAELEEELGL